MNVHMPGLDKWSLPLMRGERIPEDPPFALGCELDEHSALRDEAPRAAVREEWGTRQGDPAGASPDAE
jgi:hypothetical protein